MNLTKSAASDLANSVNLVNERFIPAMERLAVKHDLMFAQTPTKPHKTIVSRRSNSNICFQKTSWRYCHIYFEFLKKDWMCLQYGCGYWIEESGGRIEDIDEVFNRIKMARIMSWHQNRKKDGGSWICKQMDRYCSFDEGFFRDLIENEEEIVRVFEEKILRMLSVVSAFELIL